jgi:hypothetical protein
VLYRSKGCIHERHIPQDSLLPTHSSSACQESLDSYQKSSTLSIRFSTTPGPRKLMNLTSSACALSATRRNVYLCLLLDLKRREDRRIRDTAKDVGDECAKVLARYILAAENVRTEVAEHVTYSNLGLSLVCRHTIVKNDVHSLSFLLLVYDLCD